MVVSGHGIAPCSDGSAGLLSAYWKQWRFTRRRGAVAKCFDPHPPGEGDWPNLGGSPGCLEGGPWDDQRLEGVNSWDDDVL